MTVQQKLLAPLVLLFTFYLNAASLWAETITVFSGPVSVPLEQQTLTLDLVVTAEPVGAEHVRLRARTPTAPVLEQGQAALAVALNGLPNAGKNRFFPGRVDLGAAPGLITVRADLRYERWEKLFGSWKKILQESGTIHAGFAPSVQDGRLHLTLRQFRIDGLSAVSRFFDIDKEARRKLAAEIAKLNANDTAMLLPKALRVEGYAYESVGIDDGLTLSLTGPDSAMAMLRVIAALRDGGL